MKNFENQLKELKGHSRFSAAVAEKCNRKFNGEGYQVTIPNFPIPRGWNYDFITVVFDVFSPPYLRPENFWTYEDIRYFHPEYPNSSPCVPQLTRHGYLGVKYPDKCQMMWFYKPRSWSPNSDTLTTYAHFIRGRFNKLK